MKTFFIVLGALVLAIVIFAGGVYAGVAFNFFGSMLDESLLKTTSVEAMNAMLLVEMLDENRVDDAKAHLNLTLDPKIPILDSFISKVECQKSNQMIANILSRIARQRQKSQATSTLPEIDQILEKYLSPDLDIQGSEQNDL